MNKVYLGLGGNVGDVKLALETALNTLKDHPNITIVKASNFYKTPPWGDENQAWFINACVLIETSLKPIDLLEFVKSVEIDLKRKKTRKWGPRTLDIDLLIYENVDMESPKLTLPHPRMSERAFVLVPLNDIAPDLMIKGEKISTLLEAVSTQEIKLIENI